MPYNVNRDSGMAERQDKMQLTSSDVTELTGVEGVGGSIRDKRFAQLTYQVNSVPINLSGDVIISDVGIDDSGMVKLSGDQLKVFDQGVIDAINDKVLALSLSAVGLNANGDVALSGDQLKTFDQGVIDAINDKSTIVGLNADGDVKLSGDQLKTFDQGAIDHLLQLNIDKNYSRIVQSRGTDIYFAHAPIGSLSGDSSWRVYKLDDDGSRTWVDSGNFSQAANIELSGLTFNY